MNHLESLCAFHLFQWNLLPSIQNLLCNSQSCISLEVSCYCSHVSYSASLCNFVSFPLVVFVYPACGRHDDLVVSALVSGLSSLSSNPDQGHSVVFTLTVPLSTLVYKLVPANIHVTLGVTL